MTDKKERLVTLGKFGSTYGVKGWLRVNSYTEDPATIFDYAPWIVRVADKPVMVEVQDWKVHAGSLICKLNVLQTLEQAKEFNNLFIYVKESALPELEDEYYWKDLIGCSVYTPDNYLLGKVKEILETGSNDVLVCQVPAGDKYGVKQRLIPYLPGQYVVDINIAEKKIIANWDPEF